MFFKFQEEMRKIFLEDIDKHNVLSWIIYKTNYQNQYEELSQYQCHITTRSVAEDTNINHAKVQRILKNLEAAGFISYVKKSKSKHESSIVYATFIAKHEMVVDTVADTVQPTENATVDKQADTVTDTSSKNKSNIYNRIIHNLNQKTSRRFNPAAKKNIQLIQERLQEGYVENDFYRVISVKCERWLNHETMNQYLRPETLFGDKFDSYLNENNIVNTKKAGREL